MALSVSRINQLKNLLEYLNIKFRDINLLNTAFCHKSFAKEHNNSQSEDNERLEFLGDAVLKLIISEYLYTNFPDHDEGYLTKMRASIISDATLANIAIQHNLGKFLLLSKNESLNGGATRKSNVANALEALFGSCYLDGGIETAKKVVLRFIEPAIKEAVKVNDFHDYKSLLQEQVQALGWKLPEYRVIQEIGPEHKKTFVVQAKAGKALKKFKAEGVGQTKKEAEQQAAERVVKQINEAKAGR